MEENKQRFPVEKLQVALVQASETVNYGENYFLSNLDTNFPFMIETVYCFKSDEKKSSKNVASVIKEALAKVLVHYYPLAGSLMIDENDGKFFVKCTNKGVAFVEAEADCEIDVLGDITIPDSSLLRNLVYTYPQETSILDMQLLTVQVTRFKCGGFVLGVVISHMMVDGISGMEFICSWAETARTLPITNPPYLNRRILASRQPPLIKYPHNEYGNTDDISGIAEFYNKEKNILEAFTFDKEKVNTLKRNLMQDADHIKSCTSFTVLTALIWRSRCKALKMKPDQVAKLFIYVDGSSKGDSPLPKGYFGNRVTQVSCSCSVSELIEKPLSFAVEMVQNCIKIVTWDYMKSVIDFLEVNKENAKISLTSTLASSSWGGLSFDTADFGWGKPYQTGGASFAKELLLFHPTGKREGNGITVLLCMPETAMEVFKTLVQI